MLKKLLGYAKYSGIALTIKLNPFHWLYKLEYERIPKYADDLWLYGENYFGFTVSFLFVRVSVEIDDGSLEDEFAAIEP